MSEELKVISSVHEDRRRCLGIWTFQEGPSVDHFGGRHPAKVAIDKVTVDKSSERDWLSISVSGEIVGTTQRAHDEYWTGSESKRGPGMQYPVPAWLKKLLQSLAATESDAGQRSLLEEGA